MNRVCALEVHRHCGRADPGRDLHACLIFTASRRLFRSRRAGRRSRVDTALMARVESVLNDAKIPHEAVYFDTIGTNSTVRMRFADTDTQLKAKDTLQRALSPDAEDPDYIVALNLISNTPRWLVSRQCAADVPRARPARRRALSAASRHARRDRQAARYADVGHPHAVAREEYPPCRNHQDAGVDRYPLSRRGDAHARAGPVAHAGGRTGAARDRQRRRSRAEHNADACRAASDSGLRASAEHFDAA